jgi:lysyl-tRNA synthetase class 1
VTEGAISSSPKEVPEKKPLRIPYAFASMIAQVMPEENMVNGAIELLKSTGHITGQITNEDKKNIEKRLLLAKYWAEHYADDSYKIKLLETPDKNILSKLNENQKESLRMLSKALKTNVNEKELYEEFFKIAGECGISAKELFSAAYLILLGKPTGPRLAQFILAIGKEKISKIFSGV